MNQAIDFSTLTWVKNELDETLREARQALESHVENPNDQAQLGFLSAHLHQVSGTLQMVELYGAALLAEEMEHVAKTIASMPESKHEEACEVLMRAILQLPDYLDRLIAGYRDIPLVLLPILNDMRAVRGEPLLSDNAMFSPNLDAELPAALEQKTDSQDVQANAKALRHEFQLGLLGWLRGHKANQSLESMTRVLRALLESSEKSEVTRLWWVADGIVETLADGTLDSTVAVKRLFGQVDREIKRISDVGESLVAQEPALDLFKNLLFYAAQSKGCGPQIAAIKSVYKLKDLLPGEDEIEAARESLSGQNADLFATVSVAVKEELARLKDSLDIVLRSADRKVEEMEPLVDSLSSLGDTLGMLSLDAARKAMLSKAGDLRSYVEADQIPPETLLMDVASTLLFVESSVDDLGKGCVSDDNEASISEQIAKHEYDQVMGVVLNEAIADLSRGKEAIVSYVEAPEQSEQLDMVPQLFNQVKGGLLLLGESRAAALIGAISRYISNELIRDKKQAPQDELNSLADSICGLEYFLEGRKEHRMFGSAAMSVAEVSVEKLGYPADSDDTEIYPEEIEEVACSGERLETDGLAEDVLPEASEDTDIGVPDVGQQPDAEPGTEFGEKCQPDQIVDTLSSGEKVLEVAGIDPDVNVDGASTGTDAFEYSQSCEETEADSATEIDSFSFPVGNEDDLVAKSVVEHDQSGVRHDDPDEEDGLPIIGEDTDEEILEIFLEEAGEEIESINSQLPAWVNNPDDSEALASVRRSYHTLKGSGRLVGAMRIGEFAWAFENMLNRLIEGMIQVSPAMLETLDAASNALPELVGQIKDGAQVKQPIAHLMKCAEALSKGECVPTFCHEEKPDQTERVDSGVDGDPAVDAVKAPDGDQLQAESLADQYSEECADLPDETVMDSMLYEIFNAESRGHLEVIRQYLNRVATGNTHVDELLARALHTLHGSAHMANAPAIADLSGELERFVKALLSAGIPMPDSGIQALQRSAQMIDSMLDSLPMELPMPDNFDATITEIKNLRESVPVSRPDSLTTDYGAQEVANDSVDVSVDSETDPDVKACGAGDAYVDTECDQELLDIFLEESQENLDVSDSMLDRWRTCRDDNAAIEELQRALHTLKGGARMAGLPQIGDLAHAMESLIAVVAERGVVASDATLDGIAHANDALVSMMEQVRERANPDNPAQLIVELGDLRSLQESVAEDNLEQQNGINDESDLQKVEDTSDDDQENAGEVDPYSDIDTELLEVFLEEASDILENSEDTLRDWKGSPEETSYIAQLQRELHTLKGGARMADITVVGDLAHAVESLMVKVSDGAIQTGESMFVVLHQAHDALGDMIERVRNRRPLSEASDLMKRLASLQAGETVQLEPSSVQSAVSPLARSMEEATGKKAYSEDRRTKERASQELVRVRAKALDNMVNYAGEVSIYRSRLEQKVGAYRFNLVEMEQTISRLREQLRKMEIETEAQVLFRYETENANSEDQFDPLEMDRYSHMQQLSRSLVESVSDLGSIQNLLENLTSESETLLLQQSRVNTELQEGLMRTRMVPFLGLAARMRRIVRQTCQAVGKKAELELSGAEGEMDRTVVDRIIAPIEHMLRNAISHGIEAPQIRLASGKSESGTISIKLERESSDVLLIIADDGAGIDLKAIRKKAIERGLMAPDSGITDNEALQFILETGFSTAEKVTQVAGRGVGMDVVNSEVKQLGGSLSIASEPGKGTTFTMRLPFTLALNQALLIEVGEDTYAVPLASIEGIVQMRREDLAGYYENKDARFSYAGFEYEVCHLGTLLGTGRLHIDTGPKRIPVLLARVGEHCVAFQVENLLGSREIVVKSVGPQISTVRGVSGATILGDGRVVMILDLVALLRGGLSSPMAQVEDIVARPMSSRQLTVMVVDDSITVRKVTTRILERNDMSVISAKDGVDAVAKLQENIPDIMLLDIEMPRMDGFELATHVRNEPRLRNIPIIMITSRTGDKHRQRAMQIGVNRYLGKPFQETDLLENIKGLLEEQR